MQAPVIEEYLQAEVPPMPGAPFPNLPSIWDLNAEIEWLIDEIIPLGAVILLSAASGTGKTWVAHAVAGAVAHGRPFLGRAVQQRPVLYIDGENPLAIVIRNLRELGVEKTPNLHIWGGWNKAPPPGPEEAELVAYAKKYKPLLIWDSLVQFHSGDEQSAQETRAFMRLFRLLADAGATVIILHHTGKGASSKKYRGSSDIEAAVDVAYLLLSVNKNKKLTRLTLESFKSRFAEGRNFHLEFQSGRGFHAAEAAQDAQQTSVADIVTTIINAHPEGINGSKVKTFAKPKGATKQRVDNFLASWPTMKRGKGSTKIYYPHGEHGEYTTEPHDEPVEQRRDAA